MITTTLNRIRKHGPCTEGWTKLLKHLGKTQADDEPLPFATILENNGLDDALWCCRAEPQYAREWRLYAVWCARQVQHLMTDPRSLAALDVAERYANGQATINELDAARVAAVATARNAAWVSPRAAARTAALATARDAARDAPRAAALANARDAAQTAEFLRIVNGGCRAWGFTYQGGGGMISDENLKRAAGADVEMALTQFCRESGLLKAGLQAQEMATDLLLYRQFQNTPCRWEQDMDGNWQTGCDNVFILEAGGPEENGMKFCPYCGHHLEELA